MAFRVTGLYLGLLVVACEIPQRIVRHEPTPYSNSGTAVSSTTELLETPPPQPTPEDNTESNRATTPPPLSPTPVAEPSEGTNDDTPKSPENNFAEEYPFICSLGPPPCGNGSLDHGEECDDFNTEAGDGCSATCTIECGDGQITPPETCDDGNRTDGDGCSRNCFREAGWACPIPDEPCIWTVVCGNGTIEGDGSLENSEQCDDRNEIDGDGCSADCRLEPGWQCPGPGLPCNPSCEEAVADSDQSCDAGANDPLGGIAPPFCGDGELHPALGEECDFGFEGNTGEYGNIGCTPNCKMNPRCGDGIVHTTNAGYCVDGMLVTAALSFYEQFANPFPQSCVLMEPGSIEFDEQCDDGHGHSHGDTNPRAIDTCTGNCAAVWFLFP